jgi:hypothetical protein
MKHTDEGLASLDRRGFLRAGLLGLTGLGLADLLKLRALAGTPSANTACILVWLGGGPSHLETYDLKPDAPAEYRGEFRPIRTSVPGLHICEHLPAQARCAHRFTVLRSCSHGFPGHLDGSQHFLAGRPAQLTNGGTETSIHPEVGAVVKYARRASRPTLPSYVAVPRPTPFVGPAYLGKAYEPFSAGGNPNADDFQVRNLNAAPEIVARLDDRQALRHAFDTMRRDLDASGQAASLDAFQQEAVRLLTGPEARRAFDLRREPDRERDRYGRSLVGQTLLLARRLVEAGVSFVAAQASHYTEVGASSS